MSETKWTPGPWTVHDCNVDNLAHLVRFDGPAVIYADDDCDVHPIADCSCNLSCRLGDEQFANARLIAAAPELYEALVRASIKLGAYVGVCKDDKELTNTVLPMIAAALLKARGE